ncbi:unnamed protein product [Vitrella brassicaformis CCMP3155]|uniref:Uncharacterized protein n=1 Tax=Vitrella brassicaformis (strain CCMP3155) TaxID=1169540 RepID=A0A0G4EEY0_VITBC|nr:unnamed protein product [Vitrella brassicaformis CCMP3155]|eukprot:CEL93970.1 unnamed protein product [Vitrella brassicaformis CCMP3155]
MRPMDQASTIEQLETRCQMCWHSSSRRSPTFFEMEGAPTCARASIPTMRYASPLSPRSGAMLLQVELLVLSPLCTLPDALAFEILAPLLGTPCIAKLARVHPTLNTLATHPNTHKAVHLQSEEGFTLRRHQLLA